MRQGALRTSGFQNPILDIPDLGAISLNPTHRKFSNDLPNPTPQRLPSYVQLHRRGALADRVSHARQMRESCLLCPRYCGANRLSGEEGFCRSGAWPRVYKYKVHFGEEPPISGTRGSGIIFFSSCTLRCIYCQNAPMSHRRRGHTISPEQLARIMLALQREGCHNLNLVTCTHFLPGVLEAVDLAVPRGLVLPIVYNTSGYESLEVLRLLDGIVDIYLPDMKYSDEQVAERYSLAPDYPRINRQAVVEMHRQVGNLSVDAQGIALWGVLIRHLVLPHGLAGTTEVMRFIAGEISPQSCVSLMSQYLPLWSARGDSLLGRSISRDEYLRALDSLERAGLSRGWIQEPPEQNSEKKN